MYEVAVNTLFSVLCFFAFAQLCCIVTFCFVCLKVNVREVRYSFINSTSIFLLDISCVGHVDLASKCYV